MFRVMFEFAGYVALSVRAVMLLQFGAPLVVQPGAVLPTGMVMLFHCPMLEAFDNAGVRSYW